VAWTSSQKSLSAMVKTRKKHEKITDINICIQLGRRNERQRNVAR
jgi:hypothetical protein